MPQDGVDPGAGDGIDHGGGRAGVIMVTSWPYVPDTVLQALSTDQVPEFSQQSCEVGTVVTILQETEKLNHMPREIAGEVGWFWR